MLKNKASLFLQKVKNKPRSLFYPKHMQESWSQEGEDRVLQRIFEYQASGYYVDVGAHHPTRFSNTYLFYQQGWHGINIDPMPGIRDLFQKKRPRDLCLEFGVGIEEKEIDFFVFNEPALNTCLESLAKERENQHPQYHIEKVLRIKIQPLKMILQHYLPSGQPIDFLTIDAEGLDFEVLRSNDWQKFRPKFVLVEILHSSLNHLQRHEITQFMENFNYMIYAKSVNTVFFKANEFLLDQ